ncbi:MAG: hypothetical protein FJ148_27425 [Deltaproteobacteria bacterium]|nr:hypothetical protein [Deltaproteobacteria bacterium]
MQSDEHGFLLRFSVRAEIPSALLEDDEFDERGFLEEWERGLKPEVVRAVFQALRAIPGWDAHVRNRGTSADDEIEIVVERGYAEVEDPPADEVDD